MRLTLASLSEIVRQELARPPSRSTYEALVNEAGEAWVNAASWRYLRDRSQEIESVAGVEAYRLGRGVRSVERLHRPDNVWRDIPLMDYRTFESERNQYLSRTEYSYTPFATTKWDTLEGDIEPRLYLLIFPNNLTERLVAQYHAGWLPLNEQEDVADIPVPLSTAFIEWLRMYAQNREHPERFPMGALDAFKRTGAFMSARSVDGESAGPIVKAPGGPRAAYNRARGAGRSGVWDRETTLRYLSLELE